MVKDKYETILDYGSSKLRVGVYDNEYSDNNFSIAKKIYAPGVISSNFNPNRFTIIKAITFNTHKSANMIIKTLN